MLENSQLHFTLFLLFIHAYLFDISAQFRMDFIYQLFYLVKHWFSYFGLASKKNFEDLFYQLLHDKNYDEALKLALQHDYLDIDLVYKCKWRHSGITLQSINSVLAKIQDKLWAINECVTTVPISYESCRTLIEFGLREANLKLLYELGNETSPINRRTGSITHGKQHGSRFGFGRANSPTSDKQFLLAEDVSDDEIVGLVDFDNMNDQQKELCKCRQTLLRYEHSLFAYESILGDYRTVQQHFDHVFYDEFRQKCPLNACIDYAREGDAHAVEILLNFHKDDLLPHLLAILSNFPETLSPYQYRNLLPCLREGDIVYEWRAITGEIKREESDWSLFGGTTTSLTMNLKSIQETYEKEFYEENDNLEKYLKPLTADVLSHWFVERAFEMESKTLLLSSAIQLLCLGGELNIKDLKETHNDMKEFDMIICDCCTESNMYLSFAEFNRLPELERLILMTGDSVKHCKERFRFHVINYLHRRDANYSFQSKANLLRDYFRRLANTRDNICNTIYKDLLDKIECDEFVAQWTQDLDDVIDEIGVEIKNIERARQAKQLSSMASQTFALDDFNGCYEACQLIMQKNYKECWALCCQLGMHKQFKNNEAKYKLLAFALAYCQDQDGKMSAKILDNIIELRKRDEKIQLAYLKRNM